MWYDRIVRKHEPGPNPSLVAALTELSRLASTRPELRSPTLSLSRVLSAAFANPPELASAYDPRQLGEDRLRDAWSLGEPIFQVFPPELREVDLQRRSQAILAAIAFENPHASSMSRAKIDWGNWCLLPVNCEEEALHAEITYGGWNFPLATSVLRLTLLPVLSVCSELLLPYHPESFSPSGSCHPLRSSADAHRVEGTGREALSAVRTVCGGMALAPARLRGLRREPPFSPDILVL